MKFNQGYTHYQLNRSFLRKFIRRLYLYFYKSLGKGVCVDFGCGVGELLSILPKGSIGFEVNETSVKYCQSKNLRVHLYNPDHDQYQLNQIKTGKYSTFYLIEVAEHLDSPVKVLNKLLDACYHKGFQRFILVVPGTKGFKFDSTHKTYIDEKFLKKHHFDQLLHWQMKPVTYFPINHIRTGDYFTYNQTVVVFLRRA